MTPAPVTVGLTAVILAVKNYESRVLTLPEHGGAALPYGGFNPEKHRTLELALRNWVDEQTGVRLGYVEQLYTFGNRHRDPRPEVRDQRVVTVSYLALVGPQKESSSFSGQWSPIYDFLPWEDHRSGPPPIQGRLVADLHLWAESGEKREDCLERKSRIESLFGTTSMPWDPEKAILRYELLYEAGLVSESHRDWVSFTGADRDQLPIRCPHPGSPEAWSRAKENGREMVMDHRRILASSLGRIRGKIRYRPVIFELLPPEFTLLHILRVSESLSGVPLHKGNFRRLLQDGLVQETGHKDTTQPGRPAELFRFRSSIVQERPAPGVGLPVRGRI